jgi:hypothetical protein
MYGMIPSAKIVARENAADEQIVEAEQVAALALEGAWKRLRVPPGVRDVLAQAVNENTAA